jgi:hypothetical protein
LKEEKIQNIYPLSPMQSGMLFHSLASKNSSAYFEQCVFEIKGEIDHVILEESFKLLVKRYDVFRTIFRFNKVKKPLQIVLRDRKAQIHYEDVNRLNLDKEALTRFVEEFKRKDIERGFDLTRDLLIRLSLLKTGPRTFHLIFSFHHTIMDGWCLGIVYEDLIDIYVSVKRGKPVNLQPVTPYVNYIRWLEKQDTKEGLRFWREYLSGYDKQATLPGSHQVGSVKEYQAEKYRFTIDEKITNALAQIARKNQVTINTVIQTIWGILLQRYNNTYDVVFGTVVSGRPADIHQVEDMVGLFINTIPVRIKSKTGSFSGLIKQIQQNAAAAKPYEYLPLIDIQSTSLLKGNLIDHAIAFENYPAKQIATSDNGTNGNHFSFDVEDIDVFEQSNYDFNLLISPGERLHVKCIYNKTVYDKGLIEKLALHFEEIARQVKENPDKDVGEIEIVSEEERQRIIKKLRKENFQLMTKQQHRDHTSTTDKPQKMEANFDF